MNLIQLGNGLNIPLLEDWHMEVEDSIVVLHDSKEVFFRSNIVAIWSLERCDMASLLESILEPFVLHRSSLEDEDDNAGDNIDRVVFAYASPFTSVTVDYRQIKCANGYFSLTGSIATSAFVNDWAYIQKILDGIVVDQP